jgi:hypothetical protein
MAAFRIAIGAVTLIDFSTTLLPHLDDYYGAAGASDPNSPANWWQPADWPWPLLGPETAPSTVRLYAVALLVAAALVTVGLATRVSTLVTWFLLVSFHFANQAVLNAGDALLRCGLFYLLWMPAGAAWSVDARLAAARGRAPSATVAAWGLRLAQAQLLVVYLFTALEKAAGGPRASHWLTGEAVGRALRHPLVMRVDWFTDLPAWIAASVTWAVLAWELTFPLLVASRRLRPWALGFGVLVHVGIALVMDVGHFSFTVLAYYVLFVPDRLLGRLGARLRVGRPPRP